MKTNVLPIAAGVFGSLALAVSTSGQFLGATIEEIDLGAPEGFVTYRVVAHFGGNDLMLAWGAIPGVAELHFWTGNDVNLLNAGGAFAGLKQEDFAAFPVSEAYDSWVTVGVTEIGGNNTDYSPGFAGSDGVNAVIVGNAFDETDGLVFNGNPKNPWFGPDVVMAQFTLAEGNGFHLEGMVGWALGAGAGFESTPFVVDNIPAPGAMALLGLAGLAGARRRRRRC
ncbi:MAG: PEP-CTERM sorting domain-containing protein [Phycisphaerales bacterium]